MSGRRFEAGFHDRPRSWSPWRRVHRATHLAWCELRLTLNASHAIALAAVVITAAELASSPVPFRTVPSALGSIELVTPVLAGLLVSNAVAPEWVDRTVEWRLTQPGGPGALLVGRVIGCFLTWAVAVSLLGLLASATYLKPARYTLAWLDVAILVGPPGLWMGAIALWGSLVGKSSAAGFAATAGYWAVDYLGRGRYTGPFHILYRSAPLEHISYAETRWWLALGGLALLAATVWQFSRGERWLR